MPYKDYKKRLEVNKVWKRNNVPRKTHKRWGVITQTIEDKHKNYRKWKYSAKGVYGCLKTSCKAKDNGRLQMTQEEFINWFNNNEPKCYYCDITEQGWIEGNDDFNKRFKHLSIDRKDNNIGYTTDNIVWACYRCNSIKSSFFTESEMMEIGKIITRKRGRL